LCSAPLRHAGWRFKLPHRVTRSHYAREACQNCERERRDQGALMKPRNGLVFGLKPAPGLVEKHDPRVYARCARTSTSREMLARGPLRAKFWRRYAAR